MDYEDILKWFYTLDNERQNDLMIEADSDPRDEVFYIYLKDHFGEAIKKYLSNNLEVS
jgi:hypothetical protein